MIVTLWMEVFRIEKPVLWTRTMETGYVPDLTTYVWCWGSPYGEFGPWMQVKRRYMDTLGMWHVELHNLIVTSSLVVNKNDTIWLDEGLTKHNISVDDKLHAAGWRRYIQ